PPRCTLFPYTTLFRSRVLDGALFADARARRAPHRSATGPALGSCFWATTGIGGSARRARKEAALEWWGAASWCSPVRLGARRPTHHHTKGINGRMLVGWDARRLRDRA